VDVDDGDLLYWRLTEDLLADPRVTRGTMMGFPCVRVEGAFFASLDPRSHHLVIKLPASRVGELIASSAGVVFAPSHRPFREWVAIPAPDEATWADLLAEAKAFVLR
jgi:hypothetical protein